ncbi:MAG: hypothetical protein AAF587_00275 [Bacteroidota bacterium]
MDRSLKSTYVPLVRLLLRGSWIWICMLNGILFIQAQDVQWQQDSLTGKAGDSLFLDQTFIVPFSDSVYAPTGQRLASSQYTITYSSGSLIILDSSLTHNRWTVRYRYFGRIPKRELSLRKFRIVQDTARQPDQIDAIFETEEEDQQSLFWKESGRIRKSGSLSRGITVGNNRSLSVNSGLRLQLEGDLGDGLKIVGAITDENIPIQPDGTTQQISDFDKVFIQLSKGPYAVTIGDHEINQKSTRFANFYRNVQGIQVSVNDDKTKAWVSGAVAKGKFHTNTLAGIDGNSGPYRLTGQNGERFFIILAGSEKVYLNGKLMQRGETNDYVIDYNTAEIIFTAKHVITNITRIVVDFEYNDQHYNRSLLAANVEHRMLNDKLNLRLTYGRDADNHNAPFEDPLEYNLIRDSLSLLGDQQEEAITSGIFELGYDGEQLRYEQRDTIIGGRTYEYYVRSTDSLRAIYALEFTFVQAGNGFYDPLPGFNANVFQWVPPGPDGQPTGSYAPIRRWILPKLLQVVDAQISYQLTDKLLFYSENAISSEDQNRLSSMGDEDNEDLASKTGIRWEHIQLSDSLQMDVDVSYQYIGQKYTNLDRVYQAEYDRKWNLNPNEVRRDEQITAAKVQVRHLRGLELELEGGIRNTGQGRMAQRQVASIRSRWPKALQGQLQWTRILNQNEGEGRSSSWNRYEGDVYAPFRHFRTGMEVWIEDRQEVTGGNTVNGTFSFFDLKPYVRTVQTKRFQLDASFNYRYDKAFLDGQLREKSRAYTAFLQAKYRPSHVLNIQNTSSYRILNILDSTFTSQGLENSRTLNTQFRSTLAPKNRLVYANFVYDVSAEQLAQREIRYIEVNPGQGQYVWLDSLFNNDGIQDVEEFQIANNPLIANFIRVAVPTRELVPTTRLTLSGKITWSLKNVLKKSNKPLKELARNIRLNTNLRMAQNKSRNTQLGSYLINIADPFADTSLLNANYHLRQDLSFFQNHPTGDIRFSYQDSKSKLFLTTGVELQGLTFWRSTQRLNLGSDKSLELDSRLGNKFNQAEAFDSRNYSIDFWQSHPKINIQFSRKFRLTSGYEYISRQNTNSSGQIDAKVNIHKLVFDSKWNVKDRNNLFAKLELVYLGQQGESEFSAEYELREGLETGANALWQVLTTWYVLGNVEMSLTYDGRVSAQKRVVHTGRVQIRAFF